MANISARLPSGPRLALASCTCRLRKWARDNQCAHTGARAGASGQRESDAGRERSLCSSRQRSMATSCVQRGAAWTFAAWCLRFSHGVRGSAGMPAVWECEGARGGVSVPNRRFFACTHRTGPARRRRASQSEAVRTHAAPSRRPACALLQQGTLLPRKRHSHSPLAPPRVPVTPAFPKERRKQKVPFGMVVRGRQAAGGDEGRVLCVLVTCRTAEGVENTLLSRYFDGCDAAAQVCMCACT